MKRILIVDDDQEALSLGRKILVREGYEVNTAQSGQDAIALIKKNKYNAILLDIMMPGMNGIEASRAIRELVDKKTTAVVFVTAKDDSETMKEGFQAGGTIFLSKPFTARQLVQTVQAVAR
jgi:DNA-binding response OmpR family regulator